MGAQTSLQLGNVQRSDISARVDPVHRTTSPADGHRGGLPGGLPGGDDAIWRAAAQEGRESGMWAHRSEYRRGGRQRWQACQTAGVSDGSGESYRMGRHRSSITSDRMVEDLAASAQREAHMTMSLDEKFVDHRLGLVTPSSRGQRSRGILAS